VHHFCPVLGIRGFGSDNFVICLHEVVGCTVKALLACKCYRDYSIVDCVFGTLDGVLQSNQVTVRLKATVLLGRMFALPDRQVANGYQQLFSEFLKRLNDEDADVQIAAVNCAKACLETMNSSGVETTEILGRLSNSSLQLE